MARPQRPWFRFYVESMRDPKIRRLSPSQRWLWTSVLSAARESCIPGWLMVSVKTPFSCGDLADYAGMKLREVETGLGVMDGIGLIEWDTNLGAWMVPKFSERQYESDTSTQRTRKHRSTEQVGNVP